MVENILESKVFFEVHGHGRAIVLLHGFTESHSIWNHFVKELSLEHKVITIDLPGHGKSGCIGGVHSMSIMAEVVKGVLDRQGISEAVVVGHSMGGYVALALAKLFPAMVKGLGLFHSTAIADSDIARKNRDIAIKAIKENHKAFLFNFIPDLFAPENRDRYSFEINDLIIKANQMDKTGIIAALEGMKDREDLVRVLETAKFPMMFIAGKKDTRIAIDQLLLQISFPSESYSLILENVGHMGYIEAREQTLEFVSFFAKRCLRD